MRQEYPIRKNDLDDSVRAVDDFYAFVNNKWREKNPLPATESGWNVFKILTNEVDENLRTILEELCGESAETGTETQKLRDFYLAAMNENAREKDDLRPIEPLFERIRAIATHDDMLALIAELHALEVNAPWAPVIMQDLKQSGQMTFYFQQAGLGLPDRDYYLKDDDDSKRLREQYESYIIDLSILGGTPEADARRNAKIILSLETELAHASMTQVEKREPETQYNKRRLEKLENISPAVNWRKYFQLIGIPKIEDCIVAQPKFLQKVGELWETVPLEHWKLYFLYHVQSTAAPFLSSRFANRHFDFYGKILSGTPELKPLWQRAVRTTNAMLGESLGKFYVKRHFSAEAKRRVNELVDNLLDTYREHIKVLDWMSDATKEHALRKLAHMGRKLGYPDMWRDYSALEIHQDSWIENIHRGSKFEFARKMKKYGKPVDREEWHCPPATINAYFHPFNVEVMFPAAFLQPPFFDPEADDAVNYGAIGVVIGHELTHGFDDEGSKFDENGNLENWWLQEDRKKFEVRIQKLIEQFNAYRIIDDIFANGALTVGENAADLGGLSLAYDALQKALEKNGRPGKIHGFTQEERFFLSYARIWRENIRDEELKRRAVIDPHAPTRLRVNAPLSNMEQFYKVFACTPGDAMYREEKDRVQIW